MVGVPGGRGVDRRPAHVHPVLQRLGISGPLGERQQGVPEVGQVPGTVGMPGAGRR